MAPRLLYQVFRIGFLLVSTFQTLNWLKKNWWGSGCTYFRSQGRLVYFILAVNSSYPIQVSPVLFALRSIYMAGSLMPEAGVPGYSDCCFLFHLAGSTGRRLKVGESKARLFPSSLIASGGVSGSGWVSFLAPNPTGQAHHSSSFHQVLVTLSSPLPSTRRY